MVGGDQVNHPGATGQCVANLMMAKLLINSAPSAEAAKWMGLDAKNFNLNTSLDQHKHAQIPVNVIPGEIVDLCDLCDKVHNGFACVEIRQRVCEPPQASHTAEEELT